MTNTPHTVQYTDSKRVSNENIKTPLLFVVSISFTLLLLVFVGGTVGMLQRHLANMVHGKLNSVFELLDSEMERENESLSNIIQPLLVDETIKKSFMARNRTSLLRNSQDIYNQMFATYNVTHFYFHTPDKVNFLRVHNPQRHGDLITRFTMNMAVETGMSFGGFELGPLGTFTLRMVRPWYSEGELIGYIEIGKEIDSIVQHLGQILDVGVSIALSKDKLSKQAWLERERFMGEGLDWDLLATHVITNYSEMSMPAELLIYLAGNIYTPSRDVELSTIFRTHVEGNVLRGGLFSLVDVTGASVGDVIVTMDVTVDEGQLLQLVVIIVVISLGLCVMLVVFFNVYLGKIDGKLNFSRDKLQTEIDERRKTEQQLKSQKEFLKLIIDSIAYPFYVINVEDYTVSVANKASGFGELTSGMTCYQLTHHQSTPCSGVEHPCTIQLIKKTGQSVVLEHVHFNDNGDRSIIEIHGYPVFDGDGKLIEVIEHTQNITERKLNEEGLQSDMSAAREANRAKSEFLANMSHEIRTPMNGILGFTELLARMELTVKQRKYVELVRNSGDRLMDIVTDILDFSKIEAKTLTLHETAFNVEEVVSETMRFLAPNVKGKGLSLDYKCSGGPKNQVGDHGRLRQILINLVNNAIKFTDKGGVTVTVTPVPEGSSRKGTDLFTVRDTGIGVPADKIELVFGSFYQVDGSSTREHGGAGLGLAISKQLVSMMGGEIWVEESSGEGTVFAFTVDLKPTDTEEPLQQSSRMESDVQHVAGAKAIRILLAEDDPINQTLGVAILEQRGYEVGVVENGRLAVEKITKNPGEFDLVLMDIQMPEMDGLEATRVIREFEKKSGGKQIPIIGVTAHAFQQDRDRCLKEGMNDYITKPINPEKFFEMIENLKATNS